MQNDYFTKFARSLRKNNLTKIEIENLKQEAVKSRIERSSRIQKIIYIQKIVRGFLSRTKYYEFENVINTITIINYFNQKRQQRIQKNSEKIIAYFILNFFQNQRKIKNELVQEFQLKCLDFIRAVYKGYKIRKSTKKIIEKIHNAKLILEPHIISFKTKIILRTKTIQKLLEDIANIKFLIKDEYNENNRKKLVIKLNERYIDFYKIFYEIKETSEWVEEERTSNPWLKEYNQIKNSEKNFLDNMSIDPNNIDIESEYDNNNHNINNYENDTNKDKSEINLNDSNFNISKVIKRDCENTQRYSNNSYKEDIKINNKKHVKNINSCRNRDLYIIDDYNNNNNFYNRKNFKCFSQHGKSKNEKIKINNVFKIINSESIINKKKLNTKIRERETSNEAILKRKKLHELEQTPSPKIKTKNVKSKIKCWGKENQRNNFSPGNIKEQGNMKVNIIVRKTNNLKGVNFFVNDVKYNSILKLRNDINNSKIDKRKKLEEKSNKIAKKYYKKLEEKVNNLNFNLDDYFNKKENKMVSYYTNIPYIKKEDEFIRKIVNANYESSVNDLMQKYHELK